MNNDTIVAVYDTSVNADAAVRELEDAGIPSSAISRHSSMGVAQGSGGAPVHHERGFWSSLFGTEPSDGSYDYERHVAGGSTIVTVHVPDEDYIRVEQILERHNPAELDDETPAHIGTGAALSQTATGAPALTGAPMTDFSAHPTSVTAGAGLAPTARSGLSDDETLRLSEESISVGKRAVIGGTTRIRRYVVETPVHEDVSLRTERVTLERRPVTGDAAGQVGDFTEKTIEMTEMHEEPVVTKTARVVEEVGLRKDVTERTETISDTVRREDVKIEEGTARTAEPAGTRRI